MKVLTAEQMREVDRSTVELGIPGIVLMENAGHRVVEFLERQFEPLSDKHVVVICGKGNNGGDGFVVARQLYTRKMVDALDVVFAGTPEDLKGDAAANFRMLSAVGCPIDNEITPEMRSAGIVVDALLGTGVHGSASGRIAELIEEINTGFPEAAIVALDMPSGLPSDEAVSEGPFVVADYTVTFTAPKIGQVIPPNCDFTGDVEIGQIGSPSELFEEREDIFLSLSEPEDFELILSPRDPGGHKGTYGHALVIAGSPGKTGAAAMAGMAALRAGAGLVTVASAESALPAISAHCPELMTDVLPGNADGKDVIAIGPGLGYGEEAQALVRKVVCEYPQPIVIDADALAEMPLACHGHVRIVTPHPGEMSRMAKVSVAEIQKDRIGAARSFAMKHEVTVVLKGQRTVIAFPDGRTWINPTGTPAMGKGGSGDILTGLIAGFIAQFQNDVETAVRAAVYLHGLAGEMAAAKLGDKCVMATDLLAWLPEAMSECEGLSD